MSHLNENYEFRSTNETFSMRGIVNKSVTRIETYKITRSIERKNSNEWQNRTVSRHAKSIGSDRDTIEHKRYCTYRIDPLDLYYRGEMLGKLGTE